MTPDQMRALAGRITDRNGVAVLDMDDAAAALRAAAGQLEAAKRFRAAVRTWADTKTMLGTALEGQCARELYAILTAGTAPKEKAKFGARSIPGVRDMTPGSVFTAMHKDPGECGGIEHRWFIFWSKDYGNAVYNDEGQRWSADSIDSATIRNYIPPKEASDD